MVPLSPVTRTTTSNTIFGHSNKCGTVRAGVTLYSGFRYNFYSSLPVWLQNLAVSSISTRRFLHETAAPFQNLVARLMDMQFWPASEMKLFQEHRLAEVLLAASRTAFYKALIPEEALVRKDPVGVLKSLPVLDKKTVAGNAEAFISRKTAGSRLVRYGTSGTTGFPLHVYWNRSSMDWERALIWRHRACAGLRMGHDWVGLLGGHRIVPVRQNMPPFWRDCHPAKLSYLSTYHISPSNVQHYGKYIRDRRIAFLSGYPSALYALAFTMQRAGIHSPLRGIFFGAEPLHGFQRKTLEDAFQCSLFDFYGLTERVVSASEFECHNGLHVNWENSYCEILDPSGGDVPPGNQGELVGTSLSNTSFTLLRYRTGDLTTLLEGDCSCGRASPRISPIETKVEDLLVMPGGKLLSASNLTIPFKSVSCIRQAQIYQRVPHELTVRIVPDGNYTAAISERLARDIQDALPEGVTVNVILVDSIPLSKSGKYSFAVSEIRS